MSKVTEWTKNHRRASAAAGAVVVLGVGVAAGFGLSDLTQSTPAQASTAPPTSTTVPKTTTPKTTKGAHAGKHHGARGQITAENGSTWTITTKAGKVLTVDISSSTTFGSKVTPATQSQFVVGDQVAVVGQRSGTTVTATRILTPMHAGTGATSGSSTGTSATSGF